MSDFKTLRMLDVSKHIETKGKFNYLSWVYAVDILLQNDPTATWAYGEPKYFGETLMVFCSVSAFGKTMTAQLPVMNHNNKSIEKPDSFQVNVAMQRCLAKAIALHGIGLSIYAGEDLPPTPPEMISADQITHITDLAKEAGVPINRILESFNVDRLEDLYAAEYKKVINKLNASKSEYIPE